MTRISILQRGYSTRWLIATRRQAQMYKIYARFVDNIRGAKNFNPAFLDGCSNLRTSSFMFLVRELNPGLAYQGYHMHRRISTGETIYKDIFAIEILVVLV